LLITIAEKLLFIQGLENLPFAELIFTLVKD
jgi:hypothetical protein